MIKSGSVLSLWVLLVFSSNAVSDDLIRKCNDAVYDPFDYKDHYVESDNEVGFKLAEDICREAALKTKDIGSVHRLGWSLLVQDELEKAKVIFTVSSKEGYAASQFYLGLLNAEGWFKYTGELNKNTGLEKAANNDHPDAKELLLLLNAIGSINESKSDAYFFSLVNKLESMKLPLPLMQYIEFSLGSVQGARDIAMQAYNDAINGSDGIGGLGDQSSGDNDANSDIANWGAWSASEEDGIDAELDKKISIQSPSSNTSTDSNESGSNRSGNTTSGSKTNGQGNTLGIGHAGFGSEVSGVADKNADGVADKNSSSAGLNSGGGNTTSGSKTNGQGNTLGIGYAGFGSEVSGAADENADGVADRNNFSAGLNSGGGNTTSGTKTNGQGNTLGIGYAGFGSEVSGAADKNADGVADRNSSSTGLNSGGGVSSTSNNRSGHSSPSTASDRQGFTDRDLTGGASSSSSSGGGRSSGKPVVIDMDGGGIEITTLDQSLTSINFDDDMFYELTAWTLGNVDIEKARFCYERIE